MSTIGPPHSECAHFSPGVYPLAFVYSVPGQKETERPVSGRTGWNLGEALKVLNKQRADLFPSTDRYQYRITNSFAGRMWPNEHSRRSQPTKTQVLEKPNIDRVRAELAGCHVVVLCGIRAGWLRTEVQEEGLTVVEMCHTADRALLSTYRDKHKARGAPLTDLWASELGELLRKKGR